MSKNYHSNKGLPENQYEVADKPLKLNAGLAQFQKMIYTLQLKEKENDFSKQHDLELEVDDPGKYEKMKNEFEKALGDLLDENISVNFMKGEKIKHRSSPPLIPYDYEYLSLFSGGLDSITIPFLTDYKSKKGILHHTITHKIPQGRAREIFKTYFKKTRNQTLVTTKYANQVEDPAYLKTRGLIFLTNALCVASELNIKEVIIPENGPFMVNIPVSTLVDPTRTTDPNMIERWTRIFNKITNSDIKVSTPFKNMTKSEVILSSRDSRLIQDTWSCSSFQGLKRMCGMCNSCLVRILSCYAIDEGEDLNVSYKRNPFVVELTKLKKINQASYFISKETATFCKSILNHEDLNEIEKVRFDAWKKRYPVLENHALDMLLGFQELKKHYSSGEPLFTHFEEMLNLVDLKRLESRKTVLMKQKKSYWR